MGGEFDGRVIVVTGGARGIGEATVRAFLAEGARAVVLDVGDPGMPLERTRYIHTDVASRPSVSEAFASIEAEEGRVDVLVNNAGIQRVGLTDEIDPDVWATVVGVHLFGAYHCSSLALPFMKRQRSGSIVTIASVAAFLGLPGRGPYSVSKAGLTALTRVMATEVAELGIRVNAVAPGFTKTPQAEQALRDGLLREDWMIAEVPMRRMAEPEEIARVVRFLASEDASYITGQTIVVDGGWTIQGMHERPDWLQARAE
jgi:NAD(P)-dependent dehydrogenase (short-subunit alcohol dehydrogenase family)